MDKKEISEARYEAKKARRIFQEDIMREYDDEIYKPTMNSLKAECAKTGHEKGAFMSSSGEHWWVCPHCDAEVDRQDYYPDYNAM